MDLRAAGYQFLRERLGIGWMPHWHTSSVSSRGTHKTVHQDGEVYEAFSSRYWPGDNLGDHLEFALKYDGINIGLLKTIFSKVPQWDIVEFIQSKPNGKYVRRIWFLYELLTDQKLPLPDVKSGNYVNLLDNEDYFVLEEGDRIKRYRIVNNLLGTKDFCPVVRKTDALKKLDTGVIREKCEDIISAYSPDLIRRAMAYLYNKETKSSFEIERITPSASRAEKFIASLALAEKEDFVSKDRLIELQNRIVDTRFCEDDYRDSQNYVGQTLGYQQEYIHFIAPKPEDVPALMQGLIESHQRMKQGGVSPVIHAAVIAYGFVFLHPFEDGNGRIHRFLIHNILATGGVVPKGLIFPVSASMLKNPVQYNSSLEAFSGPLMQLIDYQLDEAGEMQVETDTADYYRYIDMTVQAEALYEFILQTVEQELAEELRFLANYDQTRRAVQSIVDLPDRLLDLFIQLCLQNNGKLSTAKRDTHFSFLTEEELEAMEKAVKEGYNDIEN